MEHPGSDEQILRSIARKVPQHPETSHRTKENPVAGQWRMPGFSGQSRIMTSFGALPIAALRRNDPIKTHAGRFLKVTWVDRIMFDHDFLEAHPEAQPVQIPMNVIGSGVPRCTTLISPAQRVQASVHHGRLKFRTASEAIGWNGVFRKPVACVTYYLFGCGEDCEVWIDGMWCQIPKSEGIQDV